MENNRIISYRTLFFLLPALYFVFYGPYGLDGRDGGYTMGYVYRIISGELPYRDFILVRPPFSIYLHTIPCLIFPSSYLLIIERFIAYFGFALTAWISTEVISAHFDLQKYRLDKYLLSSIIFVFSVHNYSPIPMHTTDGILLGAIGIYFLSTKPSSFRIFLGMLFLTAAALTKQSFYPLPFAGLLYLLITQPRRNVFTALISLLCIAAGIYFIADHYNLIKPFIFWTTGSTRSGDFIQSGFLRYLEVPKKHLKSLVVLTASFLILKVLWKPIFKSSLEYGWLLVLFAFKSFIQIIRENYLFHPVFIKTENPYSHPQIFFLVTVAGILWFLFKERKINVGIITLCLLLSLSWCASLSWGYPTPILFSAPLMFGIIWVNGELLHFSRLRFFYNLLLIGGLISFSAAYYYSPNRVSMMPYHDTTRRDLVYDMGTVFPKLSCIKSDKHTYDKYTELKNLAAKYGTNFKTLPTMLLSNYVTDTKSPINIDWPMEREINDRTDTIITRLNKSNCYAFVEKDEIPRLRAAHPGWGSLSTLYVTDNWSKLEETNYFIVYHREVNAEKN